MRLAKFVRPYVPAPLLRLFTLVKLITGLQNSLLVYCVCAKREEASRGCNCRLCPRGRVAREGGCSIERRVPPISISFCRRLTITHAQILQTGRSPSPRLLSRTAKNLVRGLSFPCNDWLRLETSMQHCTSPSSTTLPRSSRFSKNTRSTWPAKSSLGISSML